jgi:hypothetical protein
MMKKKSFIKETGARTIEEKMIKDKDKKSR